MRIAALTKFKTRPHIVTLRELEIASSDIFNACPAQGTIDSFEGFKNSKATSRLSPTDLGPDDSLLIRGWSFAANPRAVFDRLFFIIDGKAALLADYGISRPDVRRAYRDKRLLNCGFKMKFPVNEIAPGPHVLTCLGFVGAQAHSVVTARHFNVVARPETVAEIAPYHALPGRIRYTGDSNKDVRLNGRGSASIHQGRALFISGWQAASEHGDMPESLSALLIGPTKSYRVVTTGRDEPEAGVVFGAKATRCGFQTCVDTTGLEPGIYSVHLEVGRRSTLIAVATDVLVEIMSGDSPWYPNALPIYHRSLETTLGFALPTVMRQDETLILSGSFISEDEISGVYARFNEEISYALTLRQGNRNSARLSNATAHNYAFSGLLRIALPAGDHNIEVLALNEACIGAWQLARGSFRIVQNAITDNTTIDQSASNFSLESPTAESG